VENKKCFDIVDARYKQEDYLLECYAEQLFVHYFVPPTSKT
jgi:hypothetical protein